MTGYLSPKDRTTINSLREVGVLQDVRPELLNQHNGAIIVTCADGDRFEDLWRHHAEMQTGCRPTPRIHTLAWHGGSLACAPCSPINKVKRTDHVFMGQIDDARALKGIDCVGLYAHMPCGAVHACDLPLERVFALHLRVKAKVEATLHGVQAICLFHVDYGEEGRMRTYFVSPSQWEQWALKHRVPAIA